MGLHETLRCVWDGFTVQYSVNTYPIRQSVMVFTVTDTQPYDSVKLLGWWIETFLSVSIIFEYGVLIVFE